jgi:hypothetical protein
VCVVVIFGELREDNVYFREREVKVDFVSINVLRFVLFLCEWVFRVQREDL